ncbi:uncharacterized protein TNCV_4915921 [Trichonephila clavipes]|nr:uncharacterized protein TNCV_4915921 [Trichonephila clavipes]
MTMPDPILPLTHKNLIRSFDGNRLTTHRTVQTWLRSDFHLFRYLKEFLGGKRFDTADEVKEEVQDWLSSQAADVYDLGIQKLVERYDKCLNKYGKSSFHVRINDGSITTAFAPPREPQQSAKSPPQPV